VEIPVQVNGRCGGRVTVPAGSLQDEVMKLAARIGGGGASGWKTVRKVIFLWRIRC